MNSFYIGILEKHKKNIKTIHKRWMSSIMLYNFNKPESISSWISASDQSIGGHSRGSLIFQKINLLNINDKNSKEICDNYIKEDKNTSFARFSGRLSLDCEPKDEHIVRSGYCAIRSILPKNINLYGYNGLAMKVKSDGRIYRVNAKIEHWNPHYLFIGFCKLPPNEWCEVELPFNKLLLTSKGIYMDNQNEIQFKPELLQMLGFTIADEKNGPFSLDIQWIKAIK